MNADHALGRSEAIRDAMRVVHAHIGVYKRKCEEAARAYADNPDTTGYLVDDPTYSAFSNMWKALDQVHEQISKL